MMLRATRRQHLYQGGCLSVQCIARLALIVLRAAPLQDRTHMRNRRS